MDQPIEGVARNAFAPVSTTTSAAVPESRIVLPSDPGSTCTVVTARSPEASGRQQRVDLSRERIVARRAA
jgi:hypothetical protein